MNRKVSMNLEIKRDVSMEVPTPGERMAKIPFDQMFLKDAVDIPVTEDEVARRLSAVRSAYRRWQDRSGAENEREFFIGKHQQGDQLSIRVYCKKGPERNESYEPTQPSADHRFGTES